MTRFKKWLLILILSLSKRAWLENCNQELSFSRIFPRINPPENVETTIVSSTEILVTWEEPVDATEDDLDYYEVIWTGADDDGHDYVNNTYTFYLITDLTPCEDYIIEVSAIDTEEASATSEPTRSDETYDGEPCAPEDVDCETLSSDSIQLTWSEPNYGCDVDGYYISYYGDSLWNDDTQSGQAEAGPEDEEYTLTSLISYSEYDIYISSYNSYGNSTEYKSTSCTTDEGVPTEPNNVTATALSESSIGVSWEPPTRVNGILEYYWVSYSYNQISDEELIRCDANETSTLILGLTECTVYSIQVWAENGAENGTKSDPVEAETLSNGTEIEAIYCASSSSEVYTIWTYAYPTTCSFNVTIEWSGTILWEEEGNNEVSGSDEVLGEIFYYILEDAIPYTEYYVCAETINEKCCYATTDEAAPSAPTDLRAENVSATSIGLIWSEPEEMNGILQTYTAEAFLTSTYTSVGSINSNETKCTFDSLQPDTNYTFTVSATTGGGTGPPAVITESTLSTNETTTTNTATTTTTTESGGNSDDTEDDESDNGNDNTAGIVVTSLLIAAIVVCLVGGAYYYFFRRKGKQENKNSRSSSSNQGTTKFAQEEQVGTIQSFGTASLSGRASNHSVTSPVFRGHTNVEDEGKSRI